jgi:hypothetical protein
MEQAPKTDTPALRASDADRERVATTLRDGYSHGRLDLDELQQRLDAAYAAKTMNELTQLTADLPSAAAPAAPTPVVAQPVKKAGFVSRRVRDRVLTYVVLMLFLIVIWAVSGASGSFWPIWPIVVGALILALDLLGIERRRNPSRYVRREERRAVRRERRGR